jgi:uncharacterized membrane protein
MGFFEDYFINPIVEHTGYNIVNTLVYAIIAIVTAYALFLWLRPKFTKKFVLYLLPFILLGSTVRVLTDTIDTGIAQQHASALFGLIGAAVNSGIYSYGFLTATPGIYIVTAIVTILAILISDFLKKPKILPAVGLVLWVPHFVILLPMFVNWFYLAVTFLLVIGLCLLCFAVLSKWKMNNLQAKLAVLAHVLDGCASFVAIEVFNRLSPECTVLGKCYFGQHVVESFFGKAMPWGTAIYVAVKVLFVLFACRIVENEKMNESERNFIYALVIIFGLAPGIRNLLRLLCGA